jgi:hypothetical protein
LAQTPKSASPDRSGKTGNYAVTFCTFQPVFAGIWNVKMENVMTTRKLIILCALAIGLSAPACAKSAPVIDCPLRDAPYSIDSPLMDILLKPEADRTACCARYDGGTVSGCQGPD